MYLPFYGQESLTDWKARNRMTREIYHSDGPRSPVPDISHCLVARNQVTDAAGSRLTPSLEPLSQDGNTPLHLACRDCDIPVMSIMVNQGSDLSVTNHVSRFKLISAAAAHLGDRQGSPHSKCCQVIIFYLHQ
jgi:ankyrin repeat protein